ncbi:MAG: DUF3084 domain-containing protein [Cyanobacteria bacterium J06560_2]
MTGFILLFAVACLGGVIATVGDRIGMKVGKSRLSLFNLRPRQTATLVSVVTGMVASFSTLMLLIALDSQLRKGLFELDDIQQDLSQAQSDLEATRSEKASVESTLAESTLLQVEAQERLRQTNRSLRTAAAREEEILASLSDTQSQLETVSEQADGLQGEIGALQQERQSLIEEQTEVRSQITQRDQEIAQRNTQLSEQSEALASRTAEIAQRDEQIAQREGRLEELQNQQKFLDEQIAQLEVEFEELRFGNVAIPNNANLALNRTTPRNKAEAVTEIEKTLFEANRIALRQVWPGESIERLALTYDSGNFDSIAQRIVDGSTYIIIVSSGANYTVGEPCVSEIINREGQPCLAVNIDAVVDSLIYSPGDGVASVDIDDEDIRTSNLRERLRTLTARIGLQAERDGVINFNPIIAGGLTEPILDFFLRVQNYGQPLRIQAIASQPVNRLGPVYVELAAVKNGEVLFTTLTNRSPQ